MILIAGAGISGLALGFSLQEKGIDFRIVDPAEIPGGKISTIQKEGFLLDTGPNTLLADQVVMDFLHRLGLSEEIIFPEAQSSKRFIFRNGRFHGLSNHPLSLAFSPLLHFWDKLRIWKERNVLASENANESFAAFVRRRFGEAALNWLAMPVQYGIHAADPEKLLVKDAFASLARMEDEHGSVLRGLMKSGNGARPKTLNFKNGMQSLSSGLANALGKNLKLRTELKSLEKTDSGWLCTLVSAEGSVQIQRFDKVVFCMPAPQAAKVLHDSGFVEMGLKLSEIRYNPMAVAHMAFRKTNKKEFQGFGGLVPAAAGFKSAGAIWTSSIFSNRAPADVHLLAGFFGGALQGSVAAMSEYEIKEVLQAENPGLYGRMAESFPNVKIWKEAIPQYDMDRRNVVEWLQSNTPSGILFLANWKAGVALSDCIRNAIEMAGALSEND